MLGGTCPRTFNCPNCWTTLHSAVNINSTARTLAISPATQANMYTVVFFDPGIGTPPPCTLPFGRNLSCGPLFRVSFVVFVCLFVFCRCFCCCCFYFVFVFQIILSLISVFSLVAESAPPNEESEPTEAEPSPEEPAPAPAPAPAPEEQADPPAPTEEPEASQE